MLCAHSPVRKTNRDEPAGLLTVVWFCLIKIFLSQMLLLGSFL